MSRDRADATVREELLDPTRGGAAIEDGDARRHRLRGCAAERNVLLVEDTQAGTHVDTNRRSGQTTVGGSNRQSVDGSARPGDAPVSGAGTAVVPSRDDRQQVEVRGTGDRPRERTVGEGGVRLDHPDQRDPRGVEDVAVVVRIDGRLESCE